MSATSSRELIEAAIAAADRRALERVEQARARREREQQQRAELTAARKTGLARRHAAKLRRQANRGDTPTTDGGNRGDIDTVHGPTVAQTAKVADPSTCTTQAVARSPRDLANDRVTPGHSVRDSPSPTNDRTPSRSSVTDDQPVQRRWSSSSLTRARGGGHAGTPE